MKRLTLLRHAKSEWEDGIGRDFDRPLNAKGRRAARTVGRHMRDEGLAFDRVLASPAARVVETLDALGDGYGRPLDATLDRRIYLASASTLLDLVHETPEEAQSLLVSGHNPGMEDLVLLLTAEGGGDARGAVEEKFPTASLAEITFEDARWAELKPGSGTLARFVRPRDLDPTLGPDQAG